MIRWFLLSVVASIALFFVVRDVARPAKGETACSVTDGDTIRCGSERIRIHSLNCPELGDPGGPEAKRALQAMLSGKRIEIRPTGRYTWGRTVARVFAGPEIGPPDSIDCAMLRNGACREYTFFTRGEYARCRP